MHNERQPHFLADVRRLLVRDPLAEFLGAADKGLFEYRYDDAVRLAGHSCPTVASAYMLTCHALAALYPDSIPERGGVQVRFRDAIDSGVTGVIASVVTLLTGAAHEGGFKGVAARFVRRNLLDFAAEQPMAVRFSRLDNGAVVDAQVDLAPIPADPAMPELMACSLHPGCGPEIRARFAELWQERVRKVLIEYADDPKVYRIQHQPG
ncbi:hypothetical protein [Azoarcus sp. KH32C]|uniref:hypothetical protein n=1 Tax=Azoarcus sp. KH32C TaxID=748247 RepID=UPI0002386EB8|nr:hypothetical protein [Azoarcus sp. KH32C]BAL24432.1 hypothetical protein AZKH_2119 [Azoarcus sp. KH32C]